MRQLDSLDFARLVDKLGGAQALSASASACKAFLRPRGVKSAVDVLRLALMYGPGGCSLRALAALAAADAIADVSDVAVLGRLQRAGGWLRWLCEAALRRAADAMGVGCEARPIRIVDSSRLPGPGDRVWRLHLCYDARGGRIVDAAITTTRDGDRLDRLAITPGEIRIGDRGFARPEMIKNALLAGADVLVRLTWNSLQLTDAAGAPLDWMDLFAQAAAPGFLEVPVRLHKLRARFAPVQLRLVLIKKPPAAALKARAKARRASRKNQHRTDPRTLAGADYLILLTSLEAEPFPRERLGALYRLRWQVELAIKRLKSILHIDRLPARSPELAQTWLYAHLLLALLIEDASAELAAFPPSAGAVPAALDLAHHRPARRRRPGERLAAA